MHSHSHIALGIITERPCPELKSRPGALVAQVAHHAGDDSGKGDGYGGELYGMFRDPGSTYGPRKNVIDTTQPFRVHTSFGSRWSADRSEYVLSSLWTTLEQERDGVLHHSSWQIAATSYLEGLTPAVRAGQTIVLGYWTLPPNSQTTWMDRPPCNWNSYYHRTCGAATFSDFSVTGTHPPSQVRAPSLGAPSPWNPPSSARGWSLAPETEPTPLAI